MCRLAESGALRLRVLRGRSCEAVLVNTGGGLVGGDQLDLDFRLAGGALTIGTVAAEKVYRSGGAPVAVETRLQVTGGGCLHWLPQETLLFDGARLHRSLALDIDAESHFVGLETLVFGRIASGEHMVGGSLRDAWQVRRAGRLVFADHARLDGAVSTTLDRPAIAAGARATALLVVVGPASENRLVPLREAIAPFAPDLESAASWRDGVLTARFLAQTPHRLRAPVAAALGALAIRPLPKTWS